MQKTWLILVALIAIPLAGCSSSIVSDVTRFHNLPAPAAETIEVLSMDPNLQNSLEFGQYAQLVGQQLGTLGYQPPTGDTPSLLMARIGYGMRPIEGISDSGPRSSIGIGVGSGGRRSNVGVGVGISMPIGQSEPRQDYNRYLALEIIRRSDGVKLYEGQVMSKGQESLAMIMPYLVTALFQEFPGESGSSNRVKLAPQ